jgi:pyruvate dehydrogenase E2 component (dihydrolipoamide acetyltransferase)
MVVRACTLALQDEPRVNCRVSSDHIDYPTDVNIGIAVGSDDGLVVPVVLRAQSLDLSATASESRRVIKAASSGKLIGSGQGTFTISNLGMFGVESFTAIINPPEGAILAVGAVRTEVIPHAGGFLPRAMLKVTLSSDHRAIDGLIAARFLARLKHLLEHPERL